MFLLFHAPRPLIRCGHGNSRGDKLRLVEHIAEPLDFAHPRGFIHRELKPENIMIGAFGEVLVMDWGLAKGSGTRLRLAEKRNRCGCAADAIFVARDRSGQCSRYLSAGGQGLP